MSLAEIEEVQIDDTAMGNEVKFVIAMVSDGKVSRYVIISTGAEFHKDVFGQFSKLLDGELGAEPMGGGRLTIDEKKKTIRLWGSSTAYGPYDRKLAERLLRRKYPGFNITME